MRPGDLVWVQVRGEPTPGEILREVQGGGVLAWRVAYWVPDETGEPVRATGTFIEEEIELL